MSQLTVCPFKLDLMFEYRRLHESLLFMEQRLLETQSYDGTSPASAASEKPFLTRSMIVENSNSQYICV